MRRPLQDNPKARYGVGGGICGATEKFTSVPHGRSNSTNQSLAWLYQFGRLCHWVTPGSRGRYEAETNHPIDRNEEVEVEASAL
jgi:hypothetical protein